MNIFKIIKSKILYKLIIGFVFISLFVVAVSFISISTINKIERSYGLISTKSLPLVQYLKDMKFACLRLVSSATEYALIQSESNNKHQSKPLEQESNLIKQSCNSCHKAFAQYEQLVKKSFPELVENTNVIRHKGDSLHIVTVEFIEMKKQGIYGQEVLEKKEEMEVFETKFLESVNHTISHTNDRLEDEKSTLDSTISSSIKNILVFSGLTFFLSVLIGILYSRSLSKPITKLTKQVNDFKKGNLDEAIDIKSFDEIGVLGKSFQEMAEKIKRLISQLEDEINESKKAQEALRESEERMRDITFSIADWVWEVDENGVYTYSSQKGLDLLGRSIDEIIGKTPFDFMPPDEVKRVGDIFSEIVANKMPIKDLENWNIRTDGKRICLLTNGMPILDEKGNLKGYRGVDQDITERKLAEEVIKQKNIELAELNSSKDRFFSIIAHDLKSPFTGFLGLTKVMADHMEDLSMNELQKYSKGLKESASGLYKLLENLLTWARSQSKSIEFKRTNFDLSVTANECINLLKTSAENKGIEIHTEIKENTKVYADYNMITTVIRNLISNAIKFTDKNGKVIISSEMVKSKDNYIVISIKDNGVGMDKEAVEKLFSLDVRQSTRGTSNEKGTGLGLLICKDFVEKNKGKIWVESEYGVGSTFKFTLQRHEQSDL